MTEAVVKYEPNAPVKSAGTLKSLLEANQHSLASLLPRHVTPERIIKTLLVAVNRNPTLLQCTQASLFETIQRSAELGLDLSGTLGEAYPVPYKKKNGDQFEWQCQLIPGYRGLAKLARQSGEIQQLESEAVYQNDHFVYQKGTDPKLEFRPKLTGDRGDLVGFYSYVRFKDGGQQAEYMTLQEVRGIMSRSKSKDNGPWQTDFSEMGRKTVFRRLAKWLPLSSEKLQQALEQDALDFDTIPLPQAKVVSPPSSAKEALDRIAPPPAPVEAEVVAEVAPPPPAKRTRATAAPPAAAPVVVDGSPKAALWNGLATKLLGDSGPGVLTSFLKSKLGGKALDALTGEEEERLENFLNETTLANSQAQGNEEMF